MTTPAPDAVSTALSMLQPFSDAGLDSVFQQAWQQYLNGVPIDQIMQSIRSSDAYKARFPGMAQLAANGQAISEAEYVAKEAADQSLLRAYGLPDQVATDRNLLGNLIANQVGTTELQDRLNAYKQVVNQLPGEVTSYLRDQYGIQAGDLMHFWMNPDEALPAIQQKVQAAQVGAAAQLAGYGQINPDQALRLAQVIGADPSGIGAFNQAMSGFEKAGELKGLTDNLPGQGQGVTQDQLVNATVGGDAQAALALQQEQQRRKAQFSDQSSVATTQAGAVGLARANV